jgi:hypothetical protein
MNKLVFIFVVFVLISCQDETKELSVIKNGSLENPSIKTIELKTVPDYLKSTDFTTIDNVKLDTIKKNESWNNAFNLSNESSVKILGEADSPFPNHFELLIIGIYEGGDCGAYYYLVSIKDSAELSRSSIVSECAWEANNSETFTYFTSDTTFITVMNSAGIAEDTTGYLAEKSFRRILQTSYSIQSSGDIVQTNTKDSLWIKNEKYDYHF